MKRQVEQSEGLRSIFSLDKILQSRRRIDRVSFIGQHRILLGNLFPGFDIWVQVRKDKANRIRSLRLKVRVDGASYRGRGSTAAGTEIDVSIIG